MQPEPSAGAEIYTGEQRSHPEDQQSKQSTFHQSIPLHYTWVNTAVQTKGGKLIFQRKIKAGYVVSRDLVLLAKTPQPFRLSELLNNAQGFLQKKQLIHLIFVGYQTSYPPEFRYFSRLQWNEDDIKKPWENLMPFFPASDTLQLTFIDDTLSQQ